MTAAQPARSPYNKFTGRTLEAFTIAGFGGAGICLITALFWQGEEPSKLHTITVALGIHLTAILIVLIARQRHWIESPALWISAFTLKLVVCVWLTQYVWYEPLAPDLLRVPIALPGAQDSNLYDYYALEAAQNGITRSWELLNFTWLSFGITGYIALVYTALGVSVAYVSMCNALLSIAGLIMLCASLRLLFGPRRTWDWISAAAFIPSIAFYDATPAKEPLTHVFFYAALFALVKLSQGGKFRIGPVAHVLGILGLLALVRANAALMLVAANAWPFLRRFGLMKSLVAGVAGIAVAIAVVVFVNSSPQALSSIFNIDEKIETAAGFIQEREDAGESGLKQAVAKTLAPKSASHLILLSPLRAVIWFYLPYPLIVPAIEGITLPPTLLYESRLTKVRAVHELAFVITGWMLLLATPFLLEVVLKFKDHRYPKITVLLINIAVPAMIIGNFMFIMGRRYRTLIEPLVLAVVLVAIQLRLGQRLAWPIWLVMAGGVGLTAVLRS